MREAMRGGPPADLPGGFWTASQGVGAPDLVENVLDFLRGGAPGVEPRAPDSDAIPSPPRRRARRRRRRQAAAPTI